MKKITYINIDFNKDNELPELHIEELKKINKIPKPVFLRKRTIDRNISVHKDLLEEEYNDLILQSLYNSKFIIPANKEKPDYFHFVANIGRNKNSVAIVELSESKPFYEIVHIQKMRDRGVKRLLERDSNI